MQVIAWNDSSLKITCYLSSGTLNSAGSRGGSEVWHKSIAANDYVASY